uniref:Uncharacterized protein n=1 Tax=Pseudo-nitzschia arenysensis TaxID=697910 RepID=A0A7R9ZTW0_9STRA|mmetsp:Transcript_1166/g.2555  ORF Transcript_1166/g.2555 Transcript_1166/m.2555 type:complete len:150 (+) Transcript_1166:114-563(+)
MYEPEDKEVVYTEYLAYRERKAKEKADSERAVRNRVIKSEPSPQEHTKRHLIVEEEQKESNNTATTIAVDFTAESRLTATSRSTIDHNHFYLEMDSTSSNKDVVGNYHRSINDTERTDVAIVVSKKQVGDDTTTIYPAISSTLGKLRNV